jgi:hypothetical protein
MANGTTSSSCFCCVYRVRSFRCVTY